MGNESIDWIILSTSNATPLTNTNIVKNISKEQRLPHFSTTTRINTTSKVTRLVTSKYEKILRAFSEKNPSNGSEAVGEQRLGNQTNTGTVRHREKLAAFILPLALLGIFLTLVVLCHRLDTIRNRRRTRKRKNKGAKTLRSSETEQAVEEIDQDADVLMMKERHKGMVHQLRTPNQIKCDDVFRHAIGRCMCKVERCAHCLGLEAKKLQWRDLVYNTNTKPTRALDLKHASTQTWMPMHKKFRELPQSSHKDSSQVQTVPCTSRKYVVEADSVFESEVSSKPRFPSSASNYTDSKTSDFLSSIREVSESFYYSATSAHANSEFSGNCSQGQHEDTRSRNKCQKQRILKKQFVSEAQLLSDEEAWI